MQDQESGDEALRLQAQQARMYGERVFGAGGVVEQMAAGKWNGVLSDRRARDVADVWRATGEHARASRALSGLDDSEGDDAPFRHSDLWLKGLPLNRKERYYTGTVFPFIVGSDGFAHLGRFLQMCGVETHLSGRLDEIDQIHFVTEYGFAESVVTPDDRALWGTESGADTPDIVIAGRDWLVAIEAKMFHNPDAAALDSQMRKQNVLVERWAQQLGIGDDRVKHVLLLPESLRAVTEHGHSWTTITWEDVLDQYRIVGPRYWVNVLATALANYPRLVSRGPAFGANNHDRLAGAEIVAQSGSGGFTAVGRAGGLHGPKFAVDVQSGAWRDQVYEVRRGAPPNANWFSVEEFVTAVGNA